MSCFYQKFVDPQISGQTLHFGNLLLVMAHHNELDENFRCTVAELFPLANQISNSRHDLCELAANAISLVALLIGAIDGDNHRIHSRGNRLSCGLQIQIVSVGAGSDKNAPLFCILNELQKITIDERLPLLIEEKVKKIIPDLINNSFELVEIHQPGPTSHSSVAGHAQRAAQIANIGGLHRENEGSAPTCRSLRCYRHRKGRQRQPGVEQAPRGNCLQK